MEAALGWFLNVMTSKEGFRNAPNSYIPSTSLSMCLPVHLLVYLLGCLHTCARSFYICIYFLCFSFCHAYFSLTLLLSIFLFFFFFQFVCESHKYSLSVTVSVILFYYYYFPIAYLSSVIRSLLSFTSYFSPIHTY